MARADKITVAIVDDHAIVRKGLVTVLEQGNDVEVVVEASDAASAIRALSGTQVDVVILDLSIPGGGATVLKALEEAGRAGSCLVFTANDDPKVALRIMQKGIGGYLLKGPGLEDISKAIRTIAGGEKFVSPAFAARMVEAAQSQATVERKAAVLTHREYQIISEVAKGKTNREIGEALHLSEKTVKHYMTGLMQKLQVSNRVAAVMAFRRLSSGGSRVQHP